MVFDLVLVPWIQIPPLVLHPSPKSLNPGLQGFPGRHIGHVVEEEGGIKVGRHSGLRVVNAAAAIQMVEIAATRYISTVFCWVQQPHAII